MPKYKITDPKSGKVVTISGDNPPTQQDADAIFSKITDKKTGEWIPNVAQFVGNVVGTPFGKPGRVVAGTVTRAAGEVIRQGVDPKTSSIDDATRILMGLMQGKSISDPTLNQGPNVNQFADKQQAKEQLTDLAKEAAIGAATTAAGEYVVNPALEKVGKFLKPATDKVGKGFEYLRKKGLEQFATTFKDNATAQNIINRAGGPEKLAQELIDNKIPVTKNGVVKEIRKMNSQYEKEITNKLKTLKQTRNIDVDSIIDDVINQGKKIYTAPGGAISPTAQKELADFTKYVEAFRGQYQGPKSNINLINEFRKYLDKAFVGKVPSNIVDGEKLANDMLANTLRRKVQEGAPITQSFFKKYSLLKKAEEIFYKEPKAGLIESIAAGAAGLPGYIAARVVKSPGLYRGIAGAAAGSSAPSGINLLDQLSKPVQSKVSQSMLNATPYINPAIQALQRSIDNTKKNKLPGGRLP